ncbi:hypothetical protein [Kordia jejudonensis]|uniref:hypothetical protein n=1 Tax=Kordia jejudonensis TaxID=1348245 RepID=UPI00062903B2|nr:hypothetical protein [Kordia jejudonensis]
MKKIFVLLVTAILLISCKSNDDSFPEENFISGNWKLIEYLVDPGDGSGAYVSIDSDKTLFFDVVNGEVSSNYSLCNMDVITQPQTSSGTFSVTSGTIDVPDCPNASPLSINFEITDEDNLIIHYPCIEGCSEKYAKIYAL